VIKKYSYANNLEQSKNEKRNIIKKIIIKKTPECEFEIIKANLEYKETERNKKLIFLEEHKLERDMNKNQKAVVNLQRENEKVKHEREAS